jgi:DNA-binding MarR family transcriptional regulator
MKLEDEIQQKQFASQRHKLGVNIFYTHSWLYSQVRGILRPYGLTPQQFNILRILRGQYPNPCTVNVLRSRMLDKMCDASRIIERLRHKELLARNTSKSDRRSAEIIITEKGLDVLREIDSLGNQFHAFSETLSVEECTQLNDLLDKLRG